jgi:hypothetical protein
MYLMGSDGYDDAQVISRSLKQKGKGPSTSSSRGWPSRMLITSAGTFQKSMVRSQIFYCIPMRWALRKLGDEIGGHRFKNNLSIFRDFGSSNPNGIFSPGVSFSPES